MESLISKVAEEIFALYKFSLLHLYAPKSSSPRNFVKFPFNRSSIHTVYRLEHNLKLPQHSINLLKVFIENFGQFQIRTLQ